MVASKPYCSRTHLSALLYTVTRGGQNGHVMGQPLSALKIAHSRVGIWTPSNTWFKWAHPSQQPNSITIGSSVQISRSWPTDRPTDHATPPVATCRIYLVLRFGLINRTVKRVTTDCWQHSPKILPLLVIKFTMLLTECKLFNDKRKLQELTSSWDGRPWPQ